MKGLSRRVNVFELRAIMEGPVAICASESEIEMCRRWAEIYDVCAREDWHEAEGKLQQYVDAYPEDPVARYYLDRCMQHLTQEAGSEPAQMRVAISD